MKIIFIALVTILTVPFFTPIGFYLIYEQLTGKIKENNNLKNCRNECIWVSTIFFLLILLTILFLLPNKILPFHILILLIIVPFFKIFSALAFRDLTKSLHLPKKLKAFNIVFDTVICIFTVCISIYSTKFSVRLQDNITSTIPSSIETYASANDYFIFPGDYTESEDTINNDDVWAMNSNKTHYLFIKKNNEIQVLKVYYKENLAISFEVEFNYLSDDKRLEKEYADILDNFYKGVNYAPVCYLINENDANLVYGLAQKDKNTNEFNVTKYIKFNMITGEFSEI